MRIAQVAPLAEAVPPKLYGGTERVVSWLTESLVEQGHDVTLFATGDSITSAKLEPVVLHGLRLAGISEHLASNLVMVEQVRRRASEFDVIHFHVDLIQFPICREIAQKTLTTVHGRLDQPDVYPIFQCFPDAPLVSISDDQRRHLPVRCNWRRTVYHGLPEDLFHLSPNSGAYLAFLGRISPEKRPDRAIEIAKLSGVPIKIAAKVDKVDRDYFNETIKPLIDGESVQFIGEISDTQKDEFLGNATALLFPIDWAEPFGLVMIEAMATGTPIIAWPHGSVPEIIEPGHTGFIVDTISQAVDAVAEAALLPREKIRQRFLERFTARKMAQQYVEIYTELAKGISHTPDVVIDLSNIDAAGRLRKATASHQDSMRGAPASGNATTGPIILHSSEL
jgi:glycosyltransferase involved in cell wall biosynthesis